MKDIQAIRHFARMRGIMRYGHRLDRLYRIANRIDALPMGRFDAAVNNFCVYLRINRNQFNNLCYGVTT